jgi:hypothetical protein
MCHLPTSKDSPFQKEKLAVLMLEICSFDMCRFKKNFHFKRGSWAGDILCGFHTRATLKLAIAEEK